MKKILCLSAVLALLLGLSACGTESAGTTAPVQTTVDPLVDFMFQETVAALESYLDTGTIPNPDGTDGAADYSASEIYAILYRRFQEVAEHPGTAAYLARFLCLENVALSQQYQYAVDGAVQEEWTVGYAYDSQGRVTQEPVLSGWSLNRLTHAYFSYNGQLAQTTEMAPFDEGGEFALKGISYTYGTQEELIKTSCYETASGSTTVEEYDQGRLTGSVATVRWKGTDEKGVPYNETVRKDYAYDDLGRVTQITATVELLTADSEYSDYEETWVETEYYTYDEAGTRTRTADFDDVTAVTAWEYDDSGALLRETESKYRLGQLLTTTVTEYSYENGRLIQVETTASYAAGQESGVLTYTYGDYWLYMED